MKIAYITYGVVPSRTANSVHVMKMVNAFNEAGHDAMLIVPRHKHLEEAGVTDVHRYYGVKPFRVTHVPWKVFPGSKYLHSFLLAFWMWLKRPDLVYTRDFYTAIHLMFFRVPVVMEYHSRPLWGNGIYKRVAKRFYKSRNTQKIVVISEALRQIFIEEGISASKLLVAHDSSDPTPDGLALLPLQGQFKVGYVGHLYEGRGIELIVHLAKALPHLDFHLAGGREQDVLKWREETSALSNIHFHGFLPPADTHAFRLSCDALMAPYQKKVIISDGKQDTSAFMSPLKIFEYMASGKPILCSDLPVLREVLNDSISVLCDPEQPDAWQQALERLHTHPEEAKQLGERAQEVFLKQYTWEQRAEYILSQLPR